MKIDRKKIDSLLESRFWNYTMLAQQMGVTKATISNYLNLKYEPSVSNLKRMCCVLECDPKDIKIDDDQNVEEKKEND